MRWKQLTGRKSLKMLIDEMAGENRLRRALGPISLTALGVGCIIGAGIFVMTGRAAAEDAGPAITISYAVAALGCVFAALCYAEFAAMAPVAGSAYTYAYATLGEVFAWIIGWDLILEYAMACACVAAAWGNYLNEFLNTVSNGTVSIPWWLGSDPFSTTGAWFNLPAVGIMIVVTIILIVGIRESAVTNAVLTIVKLAVVLFVIGLGMTMIEPKNWTNIPYTQRLSSAELLVENVVADLVRGDRKVAELSTAELDQIKKDAAFVRSKVRLDNVTRLTGEAVETKRLTAEEAAVPSGGSAESPGGRARPR